MEGQGYIYDLPYMARLELCNILNQNNKWEELAGIYMKYDVFTIQNLKKEKNPTDELLTLWGSCNHTILELFVMLSQMQHYQSMIPLIPFVDKKYHILLHRGEGNLQQLFGKNTKDLKIGNQNFNQNQKPPNNDKIIIINNSKEGSEKILNCQVDDLLLHEPPNNSSDLLGSMPEIFSTSLPKIPYGELALATNNWKKENQLGKGGFGTVYKGIWKNTEVAIKKLEPRRADAYDESSALQLEQSFREIKILNSLPHENILPLYAYSIGGEAPCLIYQCMKNGSLEDRLHLKNGTPALTWLQRQEIAKGTARGLQYLHTIRDKPLIHGDIKSANILLDRNFEPKIGDFGLAREGSSDDSLQVSKIQGTRPYLPEEYINHRNLSTKTDTYSFGIVLYELSTGLYAYDSKKRQRLKEYVDSYSKENIDLLIDKHAGEEHTQVFKFLIKTGKWCSNKLAEHRPDMSQVYNKF